jgi:PiT family inorganic phosphate transporter
MLLNCSYLVFWPLAGYAKNAMELLHPSYGLVFIVVALGVAFAFVNGFHDAANVVATMISTRALEPETAILLAAAAELAGPLLLGTAVARTIGEGIVNPQQITAAVLMAALVSAIAWNLLTWWWGLPSSSGHALVGGL